jgi:hypothetical protein
LTDAILHPAFQDVITNVEEDDFSSEYNGRVLARMVKLNSNRPEVDLNIEGHFFKDGNIPKVQFVPRNTDNT